MKMTAEQAMSLAISEAQKGASRVSPNPLVGAVVLNQQDEFLQCGHHEFFGGPHAEVNALKGLTAEQLQEATVFVTLEPCAHEGKTPSCAKMLAALPIKKVVFGLTDPNPLVAGQGAAILQRAGIETEIFSETHPQFKQDLEEVCEAFLWNYREKKVFVSLKIAQSLDGQIGLKSGESQWITNEQSREYAHYLRACHDAVLVGRGTVAHDNPSLNIRHPQIQKENKVVVIDPSGALLENASQFKITRMHDRQNLYWCVGQKKGASASSSLVQVLRIKESPEGPLMLQDLLHNLWEQGIRSVMIEGGANTASHFLMSSLVNRLYVFQAPIVIGAGGGNSWTQSFAVEEMKQRLVLKNPKTMAFGNDLLVTGRLS